MTQRPTPPAMRAALAGLLDALNQMPSLPAQPQRVACPIFGNAPPPPAPSTEGLPPQMALASAQLAAALASPPSMADKWPFADPPAVVAAREARAAGKGGRPSGIQPNQVVRLIRFVKLGDSMTEAARKAGLTHQQASRVLSGQAEVAHHPAVTAAGVFLPTRNPRRNPAETSRRRFSDRPAATPAAQAPEAPQAPATQNADEVPA